MALDVEAINPVRLGMFPPNLLFAFARLEVTCGFCRNRFKRTVLDLMIGSKMSWVGCPACGAHNLLQHHTNVRTKGR